MRTIVMTVVCLAVATAAWADPKPPSTGKEMPSNGPKPPTEAEARAIVTQALKVAAAAEPACEQVVNPTTRLAFRVLSFQAKEISDHVDSWVGLARCAEKLRYYQLELEVGSIVTKVTSTHAELAARGALGLGRVELANKLMVDALKRTPKDPNVLVTAAKVMCIRANWKECTLFAGDALKALDGVTNKAEKLGVASRAFKYAARSALHLGALAKAEAFLADSEKVGGDKGDLVEMRDMITQAKINRALVEPTVDGELMLGIYHLYGKIKNAGPLLRLRVTNMSDADAAYRVEVVIDGVTEKAIQTVALGKSHDKELTFNPPLVSTFQMTALRAPKTSQVTIKVSAADKVVYEQTLPINVEPRDYLPMAVYDSNDADHETPWFYAAWVTPNAKAVDAFLAKAKVRVNGTFSGEQADTLPQVKAIYDELQAEGMSYVMDPKVLSNDGQPQRTRLPTEVLASTNAQCMEGTLLYATLFEAIGLKPIIVRVPGHAFVGWLPSPKDKNRAKLPSGAYFLETTATHDAKFEEALNYGINEFESHNKKHEATRYDVPALRRLGVTPQPFD